MDAAQRLAWANPPVDDVGYLSSAWMLELPDDKLRELIEQMEVTRYQGWRNYQNRWRDVLGLDSTHGKRVLDYGCGTGIEALQYVKGGNDVEIADITQSNVDLAGRVLAMYGFNPTRILIGGDEPGGMRPFAGVPYDVIHCSGVLHHISDPEPVVEAMARWLRPDGELRLMLYSDEAWITSTHSPPPADVTTHPDFEKYVRAMDAVGDYADWYDCAKIRDRFGEWFDVKRCEHLTANDIFIGAVLCPN